MRPLKLQVKGFTAFRDPVELDFTGLDVFAIAGPTGSGKSSLLDAMTYALYGRVERVGDRVSQLISQGQPRMAVTLEFEVGRDSYRVTRTTPTKGATKILLERRSDGEWRQAGEGADRVREAKQLIESVIGLDYDGFTRSVLLPQGRFAEFLVGDAAKRREILTALLGIALFGRMAERAGSIQKEASVRAQAMTDMLETEFADASPEALKEAKASTKEAEKMEKALAEAGEQVAQILARWQAAERAAEELRACADEAEGVAAGAEAALVELDDLASRLQQAAEYVEVCEAGAKAAQQALDDAQSASAEGEAASGTTEDLIKAGIEADRLGKDLRARATRDAERADAAEAAAVLAQAVEGAREALAVAHEALTEREAAAAVAEAALEEARHADLVVAVTAGLKAGDPCPVCGLPLARAPRRAAGGLQRATKAREAARAALVAARADGAGTERAADAARSAAEANAAERKRLAAETAELDRAVAGGQKRLAAVLGAPLPDDPAAEIERRLEERRRLDRAERDATREAAGAAQALLKAERERDRATGQVDRLRDRLGTDHQPLFDRAARAIGKKSAPVKLPPPPLDGGSEVLQDYARRRAGALRAFAERLATEVGGRDDVEERLLQEAVEKVQGLVEPAATLETLARAVDAACRAATAAVATSAKRAEDLAGKLARKKQIAEEVRLLDDRSRLFRQLAQELRADRLIAFLQAEALQLLAAAGSERLASVSDGRYRLVCRDEEFSVVDTWNGDEERSVRTLSGGETFLASLALALALADQVRSLSVTDRARLDSLFLDEGFGTLDPETLRTVTDAIDQLATDGRLVGVITHVRELAEQFPRIEVEKSPRGSRLRFVS